MHSKPREGGTGHLNPGIQTYDTNYTHLVIAATYVCGPTGNVYYVVPPCYLPLPSVACLPCHDLIADYTAINSGKVCRLAVTGHSCNTNRTEQHLQTAYVPEHVCNVALARVCKTADDAVVFIPVEAQYRPRV